jgi:hypothetical protein
MSGSPVCACAAVANRSIAAMAISAKLNLRTSGPFYRGAVADQSTGALTRKDERTTVTKPLTPCAARAHRPFTAAL